MTRSRPKGPQQNSRKTPETLAEQILNVLLQFAQPEAFMIKVFLEPPLGHARQRLGVMDVRTEMLVFPRFQWLDRSFWPSISSSGSTIFMDQTARS